MVIRFFIFWHAFALFAGYGSANELVRSKAELEALQQRIQAVKAQLEKDRDEADSITSELDNIEQSLIHLRFSIRQQEQQKRVHEDSVTALNQTASILESKYADALQRLGGLLKSNYIMGRQSGLRLLINQKDPQLSVRQLMMFRYVMESSNLQLNNLLELKQRIGDNQLENARQQRALESLIARLNQDHDQLKIKERARAEQLSRIRQEVADSDHAIVLYREREKSLKKLLKELTRPEKLVDSGNKPDVHVGGKPNQSRPSKSLVPQQNGNEAIEVKSGKISLGGFGNSRGTLPFPVKADIRVRYGEMKPESGLTWEGLLFDSHQGQPVIAVYPGQVVFSDWFRGYGQLMVVDHGEGYMSLYGYNQSLQVNVGDSVEKGQVIALASEGGDIPAPGLYFEIRYNGAPDDPLQWCR